MAEGHVVGTISIKVTPDTSKFRRELKAELDAIERSTEAKVKVKADFDENGLREKVKAAAEAADARAKVKVDVDTGYMRGKILNDLRNFKAKVKLEPDIDRSIFDRLRRRVGGGGGGFGRVGGGFGGGGFGGGLGSVGNFGSPANLIAIMSLLPPALAILAPALASLPALLAGVAAPIGVVALGLGGLKKAAENAGLATVDKKGKLKVGPALKQIQDAVSDVFAKGFTPILSQLLTVAGPAKTAMRGVAQGLVNIAQSVTNTLTSPAIVNQMNTLFSNIAGGLSAAAPGFSSFTTGLINLATQVSTHFPGLADWFNKLGEKFSNWVTKLSANGTLDKAISGMRPVLDSIIGFVGKLMDAGMKLAADPQMMSNVQKFLDSITNLVVKALPDLTNFFNTLTPLIEKFVGLLPSGRNNALNPANGVPPGFKPWAGFGGDSSKNGSVLFPGIKTDDQSLINDGKSIRDRWKKSWDNRVNDLDNNPFGKLGDWLSNLSPGFTKDGNHNPLSNGSLDWAKNGLGWMDKNVGGPLGNFFTGNNQWEKDLGKGASGAWDSIANGASDLGGKITGALSGLPGQVSGIWNSIADAAKKAWDSIFNAAQSAISKVIGVFSALPGQIIGILSSLGGQLFSAGANAMGRLADGVRSAVGSVTGAVKGALGGILNLIPHSPAPEGPFSGPGWNALFSGGQAIGNQFKTGLEDGFQGVIRSATELLGQVHDALGKGAIPPGLRNNVTSELKAIGQQYDQLKVQRDALDPKDKTGRRAISDQMRQLQSLRNQLKLGRDKFPSNKATSKQDMNIGQMFGQQLQKLPGVGAGFAMANINQFEQDLGISGKGAIPTIANIGVQWATSMMSNMIGKGFNNPALSGSATHIHVNSVDEAMAVKQAEHNRKAMTYAGR